MALQIHGLWQHAAKIVRSAFVELIRYHGVDIPVADQKQALPGIDIFDRN